MSFQRLAIINRGEPAMRLIHAARELSREDPTRPLRTIALYTEPERRALFVREADEAVDLGPATFVSDQDGQRLSSYLSHPLLTRALQAARAEAVWVGWGFVAEQATFAELCERLGVVFIGPSAAMMRQLGDKIASKRLAEAAGVPVVPWSGGAVADLDAARMHGERIGYPLMVKATAGGGGRGIRRVDRPEELAEAFAHARGEALRSFGDATVFMEKLVTGARHIEVQIIADHHGTTWAAGVRDCSIQRRNQKVLEEAPAPGLSAEQDRLVRDTAVRLCQAVGYRNAGTVEFLYDPAVGRFAFLEVNTRLQVEHPVTEVTTGLDLVKLQIHVARGGALEGPAPRCAGHAIEVRLNAEDVDRGFAPAPGQVALLRLPTGPGLRVDTGVSEGDAVPPEFDSMIAKIIAHGRDRGEALSRLRRALLSTAVLLRGGTTNKSFLLELLDQPPVLSCEADNGWLDRRPAPAGPRPYGEEALLAAAIETYESAWAAELREFYSSAVRGRPALREAVGHVAELRLREHGYRLSVLRLAQGRYRVEVGGATVAVEHERIGPFERWLTCGGRRLRVLVMDEGLSYRVEVEGAHHRVSRDDGGVVRAPSPAVVLAIPVKPGDLVEAGARLIVLESMKMEVPVLAPQAGRVRKLAVSPNSQVAAGAPLLVLDPIAPRDAAPPAPGTAAAPVSFQSLSAAAPLDAAAARAGLRAFLLGYDVTPAMAKGYTAANATDELEPARFRGEQEQIEIFTDLCALFRRQPGADDPEAALAVRAEEHLFTYLHTPDTQGEGLPAPFLGALRRALRHYGVDSLRRTPLLEESLLRIFKARRSLDPQGAHLLSVLERWQRQAEALRGAADGSLRDALDRLVVVAHGRYQALSDLAREVRFRYYDLPLFEAARGQLYAEMDEHLAYLAAHPAAPEREARMTALVDCPQPLVGVLARRFPQADPPLRDLMLEVLTRRYYRIRTLSRLRCHRLGEWSCATVQYELDGRHIHCVAVCADYRRFADSLREAQGLLASLPAEHDVVMDFYLVRPDALVPPEQTLEELLAAVAAAGPRRVIRRIVAVVAGAGEERGIAGVQHFTLRPQVAADGACSYAEEKLYRGLHPMMGKRLQLWRLSNFHIARLPSVEDVYLFHAVARDNGQDRRLFAFAEVRDLTPVRDATGKVVRLPCLDRMLMEAMAGIRRFQAPLPPRERPFWNRVLLYVWPPLDLSPTELSDIMHRLAPLTEGMGIEQVVLRARVPSAADGALEDTVLRISNPGGTGLRITSGPPPEHPISPLSAYDQKVARMRQRGLTYPYELIRMLTPPPDARPAEFPPGEFTEYDLSETGVLAPVRRAYGLNSANIVVGILRNRTAKHPEGMDRVVLVGDPSKAMGALAEPECRRINGAIDLAIEMRLPIDWFALSAGARISMESGTENMDWIALVLRRIVEFTQAGGEINVVVNGITVGAQPYWNAEATMLLHTRGVLIMTPQGVMVLTGKQALDYSGSVSAEDNLGIGGYGRIMGPNGQAQYFARDLTEAMHLLLRHHEHCYVAPGERFPRRARTSDPIDRDVCLSPHGGEFSDFATVGDIFSAETNPGRKRPFEIRKVMGAAIDQDHAPLERWAHMHGAEIAVVWDAHLGGLPVCLIGIESHPLPRLGLLPADGPDHFTAGTLFPRSSKKVARALNAASGNRPAVILANLSGFDGSPESMRELQLEFGAEIGRAVVNFRGPIVFCVVSRFHGGAYVVFSGQLNDNLEIAAVEGSFASVIGGAPAAAVVFSGEVDERARKDPRVMAAEAAVLSASGPERARLRAQADALLKQVRTEKLGEVAEEFDKIHSVQRALQVGSLDYIIPAATLRPYLIGAVERGMRFVTDGAPLPTMKEAP